MIQYHTLVVKQLVGKKAEQMDSESEGSAEKLEELKNLTNDIKELVFSPKKPSSLKNETKEEVEPVGGQM